jgi:hypothetical protein
VRTFLTGIKAVAADCGVPWVWRMAAESTRWWITYTRVDLEVRRLKASLFSYGL